MGKNGKIYDKPKISFGGIPNSSSLLPCLTTWAHSCSAMVLPMWTMSSPKGVQKQSHSCSCQGCKARNHTGTLLNLPKHWNSPEPSGTLRNPPEPSGSCLRNLHQHTLKPSGTFRKLPLEATWNPPEPSGSCLRNLPERSGSCLRKLHQHTLEPSGTFRKLPPEPTPAHTGTLRNLLEPASASGTFRNLPPEPTPAHAGTLRNLLESSSGTCSSDPHRHTPELIWAEDPIRAYAVGEKHS